MQTFLPVSLELHSSLAVLLRDSNQNAKKDTDVVEGRFSQSSV